jgi:GDP-L-fucose synthase
MKILVTGATGFLGSALCARLEAEGHSLTRLHSRNADLRQPGSLSAFDSPSYDHIIHLAAWTQAGDFCLFHPGEQWIINQQINTNVLAWWQSRQPQAKLISIGTSCAYAPDMPLVEENYLVGMPIASLFTYAMTKRMLYAGQLALEKQYGLRHLTLVPSTLYGPGYHTDGRQMHFIFDLIRKIIRGKLYGETVSLWGDGHQRRELIYVDDFVSVLVQLMGQANALINVGAGEEHSIREFAAIICSQVGYPLEQIEYDVSRYVGARSKLLDVTRLREKLPDLKLTPLEEGLAHTIDWFWSEQKAILAH